MLYGFLKIVSRLASRFYCRQIIINRPELLDEKGPLLLACNHPDSFFDSIIIDTLFKEPVWSLARGDVFKKPFYIRLLHALKILPVYRTSEGVENLTENYKTFEACIGLFKKDQIVTIFSEGKCINEWHLRPLKKGTARLAFKAWEENIPLRVLPVGINYSSFYRFGKNVFIHFGKIIHAGEFDLAKADGIRHLQFNEKLQAELSKLVLEIPKEDRDMQEKLLAVKVSLFKRSVLFIPAIIGWLLHAPLYIPVKKFTWTRTHDNDHYDSVMTAILLVTYPIYLLLLLLAAVLAMQSVWTLSLLLLIPFTAWSYIQLKPQLDH